VGKGEYSQVYATAQSRNNQLIFPHHDSQMKYSPGQRPKKRPAQPSIVDRLGLWLLTKINIDGLWVGTMESAPHPGLRLVEEALRLIKHYGPLHYSRVTRHLERVWVDLLPDALACYQSPLKACVLDERFVLAETTTLERIASTIIHEATHARLDSWGIAYDEKMRWRIEAICLRRELAFAVKLPDSAQLQDELVRSLEFYGPDSEYFSDANFSERYSQGAVEVLRHVGAPDWLAPTILMLRSLRFTVRDFASRLAGLDVPRFWTKRSKLLKPHHRSGPRSVGKS
jgi:hypothetical protein